MRPALKSSALLLLLILIGSAVRADPEADIQRALLERRQRSDELILRMQQSQPPPSPGNPMQQQELGRLHLQSRQRLQNLNAQQLRQFDALQQAAPDDPGVARIQMLQQQQLFERDRQFELQQLRWEEQRLRDAPKPRGR